MYNNLLNSHISNQAESNQSSVAVALSKNLCDKLLIKLNKNANLSIFQYNSLELRTSLNELYKKILEKPEYKQYQEADISAKHEFVPQIIEHVNQITKIPEYSDFLKQKYLTGNFYNDSIPKNPLSFNQKSSKPRLASEPARNQELALAIVEQPASKPRSASDLTNPTWADRVRLGRQPAEKKT
jgi:hypothetical protein